MIVHDIADPTPNHLRPLRSPSTPPEPDPDLARDVAALTGVLGIAVDALIQRSQAIWVTTEQTLTVDDLQRVAGLLLRRNGRLYAFAELIGARLGADPKPPTSGGLTLIYRLID